MADEASERNEDAKPSGSDSQSEGHEHREHSEGSKHHEEHEHGRHRRRHRRKRSHKEDRSKRAIGTTLLLVMVVAIIAVLVVFGGGWIQKIRGPLLGGAEDSAGAVWVGRQSIVINNQTDKDWGYTTITVNGEYVTHSSGIPKKSEFEIQFRQLRTTDQIFDPKRDKVQTVKIEPEGVEAIEWKPPVVE